jgi:hypothetical protein
VQTPLLFGEQQGKRLGFTAWHPHGTILLSAMPRCGKGQRDIAYVRDENL